MKKEKMQNYQNSAGYQRADHQMPESDKGEKQKNTEAGIGHPEIYPR
jgi:hypothetical protein